MAKTVDNGNGFIGRNTRVTLGTLVVVVLMVCSGLTAWLDIRAQVRAVQKDVSVIRATISDQWTKADDQNHMADFAALNDLKTTPHYRTTE